jgi:hypothetical protein
LVIIGLIIGLLALVWPLPAAAADAPWSNAGILSGTTISNPEIAVTGANGYLRNLVYPRYSANNFMEATGGGETYLVRYRCDGHDTFFGSDNFTEGLWNLSGARQMYAIDNDTHLSVTTTVIVPDHGKYFTVAYLLQNTGSSQLTDIKFYEYAEPNANSQDEETTTFDPARNMIYSTNNQGAQKYMGVLSADLIDKHDIGDMLVLDRITNDSLNNAYGPFSGDSWLAFEKESFSLNPGEQTQLTVFFLVGDSLLGLQSLADQLIQPAAVPGFSEAGLVILIAGLSMLMVLFTLRRARRTARWRT